MTLSSLRSRSSSAPTGTPIRSTSSKPSGAGTESCTSRIDPGRRPSSRVSSTSGLRGSRRGCCFLFSGTWVSGLGTSPSTSVPESAREGLLEEGVGLLLLLPEPLELIAARELLAAALHGGQRLGQHDLEVGQLGVDVVLHLDAHPLGRVPGLVHDPLGLGRGLLVDVARLDEPASLGTRGGDDLLGLAAALLDD